MALHFNKSELLNVRIVALSFVEFVSENTNITGRKTWYKAHVLNVLGKGI